MSEGQRLAPVYKKTPAEVEKNGLAQANCFIPCNPTRTVPRPTISFCTTCFNRAYQLKQVFAANAKVIAQDRTLEWVILNYASEDDLDEFMRRQLPAVSRRIVYARETKKWPWHASIAKNMAHRLGAGAVLMNLDGDNFIGNAAEVIRLIFAEGAKVLHLQSDTRRDGTYGRIAMAREVFHSLGGYDETFEPMAYQDCDLLIRAVASGLGEPAWRYPTPPGSAIRNSIPDKIKNCLSRGLTWQQMQRINREKSVRNLAARRFVANTKKGWCKMDPVLMRGGLRDQRARRGVPQSPAGHGD